MHVQHGFKLFPTLHTGVFTFLVSQMSPSTHNVCCHLLMLLTAWGIYNGAGLHLMEVIRSDDYSALLCNAKWIYFIGTVPLRGANCVSHPSDNGLILTNKFKRGGSASHFTVEDMQDSIRRAFDAVLNAMCDTSSYQFLSIDTFLVYSLFCSSPVFGHWEDRGAL